MFGIPDIEVRMIRRHRSIPNTATWAVVVAAALVATSVARAQDPAGQRGAAAGRGGAAAGPQNLQVLAKDTPQAQILQTMQAFTAALGVQCAHCHVQAAAAAGGRGDGGGGRGGRGGGAPAFDYASDDKPQKKAA